MWLAVREPGMLMHRIDWEWKRVLNSCYHHKIGAIQPKGDKPKPPTPCQCVVSRREAGYSGNALEGYDENLLELGLGKSGLSRP